MRGLAWTTESKAENVTGTFNKGQEPVQQLELDQASVFFVDDPC